MFRKIFILGILICFGFVSFVNADSKSKAVLAKVGSKKITVKQLEDKLSQLPSQSQIFFNKKENKEKLLDNMIDEEVLYQSAKKTKYHKSKEFRQQLKSAERQILISILIREAIDNQVEINDAEVKAYYDSNPKLFANLERRNVSHILVKTKKEAQKVRDLLTKGLDFAKLAKKYSIDPSKDNSGQIGWITKEQVVPEFAQAAYKLKRKGRYSPIVKSQFGYHIIKLNDKNIRPKIAFDKAQNQIKQSLMMTKRQALYTQLLDKAKQKVKIQKDISKI